MRVRAGDCDNAGISAYVYGIMLLAIGEAVAQLRTRLEQYESWESSLVTDPAIKGGEPVFPGSRLSVHHIGKMLNRHPDEETKAEILGDYPYLSEQDLLFARVYAGANPRDGRPRKHQTAA